MINVFENWLHVGFALKNTVGEAASACRCAGNESLWRRIFGVVFLMLHVAKLSEAAETTTMLPIHSNSLLWEMVGRTGSFQKKMVKSKTPKLTKEENKKQ